MGFGLIPDWRRISLKADNQACVAAAGKGLRFSPDCPLRVIPILPPEVEGLSEDQYEIVGKRVCDKLGTVQCSHMIPRHGYPAIKILTPEAKASGRTAFSTPARESVFNNSVVDVSFVADLLVGKIAWHPPAAGTRCGPPPDP